MTPQELYHHSVAARAKRYLLNFHQAKPRSGPTRTWYDDSKGTVDVTTRALAPLQTPPSPPTAPGPNPFDNLAIETRQRIAGFVEYDKDLCSFRGICRSTNDAIDADNCSFWRRRFLAHFDLPINTLSNQEYRTAYQRRRHILKNGAAFDAGMTEREHMCIKELMEMILETHSGHSNASTAYESKNVIVIKKFVIDSNMVPLFNSVFDNPPQHAWGQRSKRSRKWTKWELNCANLMKAFQVMCAPVLLSLEQGLSNEVRGFHMSQVLAYHSRSELVSTYEEGSEVAITRVLHQINFWRYHMCRQTEHTLYSAFSDLREQDRPQFWKSQLQQGVRGLGKRWKSSYAYITQDEIETLTLEDHSCQILDNFSGEGGAHEFQDLVVKMIDDGKAIVWPPAFEQQFPGMQDPRPSPKTRTRSSAVKAEVVCKDPPRHFHVTGTDCDEPMLASGWIKELPPQHDIPGWQQINMIKYSLGEDGAIDYTNLWTYDGVVLPGGQIIVGRWGVAWQQPGEVPYCGPFIMWCVDGAEEDTVD